MMKFEDLHEERIMKNDVDRSELRQILMRMKELCAELEIAISEDVSDNIICKETVKEAKNINLNREVTKLVQNLGVPANLYGYDYVRSAIIIALEDRTAIASISKSIYPEVAKIHRTTPSRVERSMRHAIERLCYGPQTDLFRELFGSVVLSSKKDKLTNSEFIATAAEKLRLDFNL